MTDGVVGSVAPPAGAWIETCQRFSVRDSYWSRPPRARGLKRYVRNIFDCSGRSRPPRARGLKPQIQLR